MVHDGVLIGVHITVKQGRLKRHPVVHVCQLQESEEVRYQRQGEQEKQRRLLNQLRDLKEDYLSLQGKEADVTEKRNVLEKVGLWTNSVIPNINIVLIQKQRICRLERKQGDTISNLSQHSWPTLLPPTHRPWKASPQCTNPYFHSKNVALSIRAKHSF